MIEHVVVPYVIIPYGTAVDERPKKGGAVTQISTFRKARKIKPIVPGKQRKLKLISWERG